MEPAPPPGDGLPMIELGGQSQSTKEVKSTVEQNLNAWLTTGAAALCAAPQCRLDGGGRVYGKQLRQLPASVVCDEKLWIQYGTHLLNDGTGRKSGGVVEYIRKAVQMMDRRNSVQMHWNRRS